MTTRDKIKAAEMAEAFEQLHRILKPGDTVYTVLRHVSGSGMSRRIDVYAMVDNSPVFITGYVGRLLRYKHSDKGGLVATGCGMDMGFQIVYSLGSALWPHGTPMPHGLRNGEPDTSGGYALRHQWM